MRQAGRDSIRARKSRHPTPATVSTEPVADAHPVVDPTELPNEYALVARGGCLAPNVPDGAVMGFRRDLPCRAGDIVALWFRPEVVPAGAPQASAKRLVLGIPHYVHFPWRDHPKSDVIPTVIVEQDNPRRRHSVRCADLLAIHKFVGIVTPQRIKQLKRPPRRA